MEERDQMTRAGASEYSRQVRPGGQTGSGETRQRFRPELTSAGKSQRTILTVVEQTNWQGIVEKLVFL